MHEMSIVDALIEQVQQELDRVGQGGRVLRLDLTIGQLSGVNCDSIRFAFELLARDTPLEGAELHIREPKAACRCGDCGFRAEVDEWLSQCPKCGATNIFLDGGQEMMLDSIELEDEKPTQEH